MEFASSHKNIILFNRHTWFLNSGWQKLDGWLLYMVSWSFPFKKALEMSICLSWPFKIYSNRKNNSNNYWFKHMIESFIIIYSFLIYFLATNLTLYLSICPSWFSLILKTHLDPIIFIWVLYGTRVHVPSWRKAYYSFNIAFLQFGSFLA